MYNFRVYYSGACFERGGLPEQVEKKVHDKIASLGEVLGVETTTLQPDEKEYSEGNYVVSFEGEIDRLAGVGPRQVIDFVNQVSKKEAYFGPRLAF